MTETFAMLRTLVEDKREEMTREEGSVDPKSIEESELKIKAVLLTASFLKF
jgi:hypothetical protein